MTVFSGKTIELKVVYYGPALCGKTTNLQKLHELLKPEQRGKLMSLANVKDDRTIFFDLLPIRVEFGRGYTMSAKLYTVPGQVAYNNTRKIVLQNVDGIVFVADSQREANKANAFSFQNMCENLEQLKIKHEDIPLVVQFNKRDLPDIRPMEELSAAWDARGVTTRPACAVTGDGVLETLVSILRLTFRDISRKVPVVVKHGLTEKMFMDGVLQNFDLPTDEASAPSVPAGA